MSGRGGRAIHGKVGGGGINIGQKRKNIPDEEDINRSVTNGLIKNWFSPP
jgi:hypothetical protein